MDTNYRKHLSRLHTIIRTRILRQVRPVVNQKHEKHKEGDGSDF